MNKNVIILTVAALMAASCGNSNTRAKHTLEGNEQQEVSLPATDLPAAPEPVVTLPPDSALGSGEGESVFVADTVTVPVGGTILLTRAVFLERIWNYEKTPEKWQFLGERPAIIDFYADWCGPCKIASPILEEISHEFAGKIDVYKIDTQREQELAAVFGVRSIPAFLYIPKNGKPTMTAGIARTAEETKVMFVENISRFLQVKPDKK